MALHMHVRRASLFAARILFVADPAPGEAGGGRQIAQRRSS